MTGLVDHQDCIIIRQMLDDIIADDIAQAILSQSLRPRIACCPYGQKIETAQRRQRSNIVGLGPVLHNKLAVDA
jgi:hypothetical protein